MTELLNTGIPIWIVLGYLCFMALVQGMPRPREMAATWYVWLYGSLHFFAVNLKLAFNPRNAPEKLSLLDRPWNKDE